MKSKLIYNGEPKVYALVFDTGDEFTAGLTQFAKDYNIHGASLTAYSPYTIDTFSLSISLSLSNHSLYAAGRKFAVYRWQRPTIEQTSPLYIKENEDTHHGKAKTSSTKVDCSPRKRLPQRPRRTDPKSIPSRSSTSHLKSTTKGRKGDQGK